MSAPLVGLELEGGVIGALLLDPERRHDLPAGFNADHLTGLHRRLFLALEHITAKGSVPPDCEALIAEEARLSDKERNHLSTLTALSAGTGLRAYAEKLMERRRAEALRAAASLAIDSLNKGDGVDAAASALTSSLLALEGGAKREITSLREGSVKFIDTVDAIKSGKAPRIRTGFVDIDRALFIRPGNFIVIAARPGEGKTTLGLQWAANVARSKRHVALFSLEMTVDEIVAVNLAREARMDSRRFYDEESKIDWQAVMVAAESLTAGTDGFLHVSDQHYGLGEIQRIAEKQHRKVGLGLIVVDYLQLVEAELGRQANRENQVSAVSRGLKKLAQRLGVPVVAMAQLNREPEKRNQPQPRGKRGEEPEFQRAPAPKLHELRESGAIEQDANAVCFIHNPFRESPDPQQRAKGPYDFIVAKQRMGPKGVAVRLLADFEHSAFKPYAESRVPVHWSEDAA